MGIKEDNVRYNILVINEIVDYFKKKRSFKVLSENIRERYFQKGQFEQSKIDFLSNEAKTLINRDCFTGEKRFLIPNCEKKITNDPNALVGINNREKTLNIPNIPDFKLYVVEMLKTFERRELIDDGDLERMMHYISKCGSMDGYTPSNKEAEKPDLGRVCSILDKVDNNEILDLDTETIKRFIKLAEEKIIICQAALILKKNKKSTGNKETPESI